MAKKPVQVRPANRQIETAPAAAPAAQPAAGGQAAPNTPAVPPAGSAPPTTTAAKPPPAADSAAGAEPAKDGEKPAEKITATEESQRIARIHRAEAKHQETVANDKRAIGEERATLERERATHAEDLKRVRILDNIRQQPPKSWVAFMRDVFGVQPQVFIDELIGHQQRPPAERANDELRNQLAQQGTQLAEMQRSIQDSAKAQEQARAAEQLREFKAQSIAPVLADRAKYELTHRALGDKAVDEVYSLIQSRYQIVQAGKSGKAIGTLTAEQAAAMPLLSPSQAADIIEGHFRKQRDTLSGAGAPPAKPPEPTNTDGPPRAEASGPPAQKPPAVKQAAWRNPPKPYTRKLLR